MRTIYSQDLQKDGDMLTLRISGSGFLYNMVRIIAGTLVKVGMGVYPPEHVEEILEARDRAASGPTIPARGLTLVGLEYEKELAPQIAGENRHWSYILNQEEVPGGGPAYLTILRCEESELAGLARRVIHQAYRNGAKEVRIADAGGRLEAGQRYGFYRLEAPGRQDGRLPEGQEDSAAGGKEGGAKWLLAAYEKHEG